MKKIYSILIGIVWIVSGASGAIKLSLKYENLTVGNLTVCVIGGGAVGPVSWLIYLIDSDTVLMEKRG